MEFCSLVLITASLFFCPKRGQSPKKKKKIKKLNEHSQACKPWKYPETKYYEAPLKGPLKQWAQKNLE